MRISDWSSDVCSSDLDWICLGARLAGTSGDPAEIEARMKEIQGQRADSQPIRSRTGGSTFNNPPGHKAWQLIDAAGRRALTIGGAMVSDPPRHSLINTRTATAARLAHPPLYAHAPPTASTRHHPPCASHP